MLITQKRLIKAGQAGVVNMNIYGKPVTSLGDTCVANMKDAVGICNNPDQWEIET